MQVRIRIYLKPMEVKMVVLRGGDPDRAEDKSLDALARRASLSSAHLYNLMAGRVAMSWGAADRLHSALRSYVWAGLPPSLRSDRKAAWGTLERLADFDRFFRLEKTGEEAKL